MILIGKVWNMKMSDSQLVDKIQSVGLRATPQRIQLLRLLSETDTHPSAEMLINMAKDAGYNISVGTVYNALECFDQKGLIRRVHDNTEIMRYDAKTGFHVHIVDQKTREIYDLQDEELEEIIQEHLRKKMPANYDINLLDVTVYADKFIS